MKTCLCIGECMVELSAAGTDLWRQSFAGDVFNTAWYARALLPDDWRVDFHTALGTDPISDQMIGFIRGAGIGCDDIPRIAGRMPGLYAIHLDGAERSFSYWRDTSAARLMLSQPEIVQRKLAAADVIYLSGITMAILSPEDADNLIGWVRSHARPGALVAFDPNIRPRLWADAASMKSTLSRMAAAADLVLPSFEDEATTFDDPTPQATAERYLALGAGQVVVKNGESPTLVATPDSSQNFAVARVENVIDTTAAGDSFNGGYLAEYCVSHDIARAVKAAQTCAGKVVGAKGALVPFELVRG